MNDLVETSVVDLSQIRDYWEKASTQAIDADDLRPTARDPYLQQVVEAAIEKWVWPAAQLLDIGCGDGASTVRFAKRAKHCHGVDFIERYVSIARENAECLSVHNVDFIQGNVMDLRPTRLQVGLCDIVTTIRCLINLSNWGNQQIALKEIAGTIKSGGLYLLSEGWSDGWEGLNRVRSRAGLGPIELVKYNCLINRTRFESYISDDFEILHYENLGFYIFMSRVFQPSYVAPEAPKHLHEINRFAAQMTEAGIGSSEFKDIDYAGVYVLRRR
jgi:SAM-dependent methyltransferase